MASLGIEPEELKSLEQVRLRLQNLSSSIQSLRADVAQNNPLPSANSLQASAQILQRNMQSLLEVLTENAELFQRLTVHPSTNYPGRTQEGILTQLLRKKPEPEVEERAERGREAAAALAGGGAGAGAGDGVEALRAVWEEARDWCGERIALYVSEESEDPYTREERERGVDKVRTGLRRELEEEDDDDEDDDEDDGDEADGEGDVRMGGDGGGGAANRTNVASMEPEELLWFSLRADFKLPPNVDFESRGGGARGRGGLRGMMGGMMGRGGMGGMGRGARGP